jgi:hypothetical protein
MNKLFISAAFLTAMASTTFAQDESKKMEMGGHMGMGMMMDMKSLDANGDGQISKEEFTSHHGKMFQKMDKNGDGKVSADERHMMMGMMMEDMMKKGCPMMKGGGMMGEGGVMKGGMMKGGMMKGEGQGGMMKPGDTGKSAQ